MIEFPEVNRRFGKGEHGLRVCHPTLSRTIEISIGCLRRRNEKGAGGEPSQTTIEIARHRRHRDGLPGRGTTFWRAGLADPVPDYFARSI
jgi:hypothetical protein